jgi:hypothetical protein
MSSAVSAFTRTVIFFTLITASCASPPPAAPSAGQVAGAWIASSTLASASGGECIGADLRNNIGRRDVVLAALAGETTINATITSQGNGTSCAYAGSNASGTLNLTLTICQSARVVNVTCSTGDHRDVQLVSATLQARADSRVGTGSGSNTTTWNVLASGSQQPVGVLNLTETFTWVYLGLPSSDYHVFTGTVFPGYADGTISIPADPNPWCYPCGWFR